MRARLVMIFAVLVLCAYSRRNYPHWRAGLVHGDRLDACQEALAARSLVEVEIERGRWRNRVVSGLWRDAHTGKMLDDPSAIHCDHLVPLAEIDRSGGAWLPREMRAAIANDPDNIALTAASLNMSRGDKDPAEWLPPDPGAWCGFAERWVRVKKRYGLLYDLEEAEVLLVLREGFVDSAGKASQAMEQVRFGSCAGG